MVQCQLRPAASLHLQVHPLSLSTGRRGTSGRTPRWRCSFLGTSAPLSPAPKNTSIKNRSMPALCEFCAGAKSWYGPPMWMGCPWCTGGGDRSVPSVQAGRRAGAQTEMGWELSRVCRCGDGCPPRCKWLPRSPGTVMLPCGHVDSSTGTKGPFLCHHSVATGITCLFALLF